MLTNAPKGTKDVLPQEVYKWHYVEKAFDDICKRYGFNEMRTPVFEHTELFKRGVGDTTDIVQKEMYTWEQAKRSLTLRPEGTAPVVRSLVEHKLYAEVQPQKYYYNIPCFRYEKPQSGRLRAFHQFGIEIFGTDNMMADAEIISLAKDFLDEMGIEDVKLHINSIGCPNCREEYKKVLKEFLAPKYDQLCDTCKDRYERNPIRILDCKSPEDQEAVKGAPRMIDHLCQECKDAFDELQENLDALGIEYEIDPGIVRGLDYYTKTAFEFISGKLGAQNTVCGGGRYDHLSETLGGPPIPGVGFGLGIERLLLTMEESGIEIPKPEGADAFIAFVGDEAKKKALSLTGELRRKGLKIAMDPMGRNMKGQFKYADRLSARYTIVIGDDEIAKGVVSVKEMESGEQKEVAFDQVEAAISR
ncbi:MAG: histidine--tRNA ligase [Firmicutes bacterium]|nr:histidine--tRNA ligase [Bacillota bacterium]